ncbi:MAG: aminopeptidase [Lachnospiraceae bacterium]|nr:aminopeptidase [Lachnospiraceae bacterium]
MAFKAEGKYRDLTIVLELFLKVFELFKAGSESGSLPSGDEVTTLIRGHILENLDYTVGSRIAESIDPSYDFALRIIMDSDLEDISYLDKYGEYVSEDTRRLAEYINSLDESLISKMADTYTEGYRLGFINTGKDITKKKTVNIRYHIGFERVLRRAVKNFEGMGLKPVIYRRALHAPVRNPVYVGFCGDPVNRQMDFDHKDDRALFMDEEYIERRLDAAKSTYEKNKELARTHAGPAVIETFGETPFLPESKEEAYELSPEQAELNVKLSGLLGKLTNTYIPGEERSFTIIAFPLPSIGKDFDGIFKETISLNTLDYIKYRDIQQRLICTLENGSHVEIKGRGDNITDMRVSLCPLEDVSRQCNFENCVADVNIPVGEVFTSPVLKGTSGTLYVSQVYLNGLKFEKLKISFEDGFIRDYSCSNFEDEARNRKYIEDNILFHHKTLPLGEFAIGTNTTAYAMAKRYDIFSYLPILIAEKTGPHFAVGDTCYSRDEDIKVYNPDGREIISRDNEETLKRLTDKDFRYYECHTDITIPYEELDSITAVSESGERYPVIEGGRFVVEGSEELNIPLDGLCLAHN